MNYECLASISNDKNPYQFSIEGTPSASTALKALGLSHVLLFNFATTRLTIKRVGREFHSRAIEEDISF
ncbi:MAG: hypothetical protein JO201_09075 [Verrucomicrobia bacterium]|nr:hypothetical protein [Verrucomicrobiota bacterium]